MKDKYTTPKPFALKMGSKKSILQREAFENERSLHWWLNKILGDYLVSKGLMTPEEAKQGLRRNLN